MSRTTPFTEGVTRIAILAVVCHIGIAHAAPAPAVSREQAEIDTLQSGAQPGNKAIACKRLAIYGSDKAVPALAPLLADPQLASWARIALEAIPGAAADEALRSAAGTLHGRLLVGTINSIAVRRDAKAVPLLMSKLDDGDADVASAAATALGRIGGKPARDALVQHLAKAPPQVRPAVAEGCILAAEALLETGAYAEAASLYDIVRPAPVSKQKRMEATRGAILAQQDKGIPLLAEQLRSEDKDLFGLGLKVAREVTSPRVAEILLAALERSAPRRQAYLLMALADRGDDAAFPAAMKAAGSSDLALRTEAVRILGRLANPAAAQIMIDAALDENAALAKEARTALARTTGPEVDKAVVAMLGHKNPAKRLLAVELVAERQVADAVPLLMKTTGDVDEKVRVAAMKMLGNIAGEEQLPAALDTLLKSTSSEEIRAAEGIVTAICLRSAKTAAGNIVIRKARYGDLPNGKASDVTKKVAAMVRAGKTAVEASNGNFGDPAGGVVKTLRVDYTVNGKPFSKTVTENETLTLGAAVASPACEKAVLASFRKSSGKPRAALIAVLGALGGEEALGAVRAAMGDADPTIRETAIRALCEWPDTSAMPDLAKLARNAEKNGFRILALRGYIRLVSADSAPPAEKLAHLKDAMTLVQRKEEKTLVLAALGDIPTVESLELIATRPFSDPALRDEVCAAVLSIGQHMRRPYPPRLTEAVETAAKTARNTLLAKRAENLLKKLKTER